MHVPAIPILILDTNVCLDLFVFHQPLDLPLGCALHQGALQAHTRADCREEWLRVLDYPSVRLDASGRANAIARFDAFVQTHACADLPEVGCEPALPRCKDRDDQKFLEAAVQLQARALLSRDLEVLALARRTERRGLFRILAPERWREVVG